MRTKVANPRNDTSRLGVPITTTNQRRFLSRINISICLAVLLAAPVVALASEAVPAYVDGLLSIPQVEVDFSPGVYQDVQLQRGEDGRWDLIQARPGDGGVRSITYATYAGFCVGYCRSQILVTSEAVKFSRSGWTILGEDLPELTATMTHTEDKWNDLAELVDFGSFEALPNVIGCPDCADQGGVLVQIQFEERGKRVDFDPYELEPGTDPLMDALAAMLEEARVAFESLCGE